MSMSRMSMPSTVTDAIVGPVEAKDQVGDRGLAGPRLADQRGDAAGRNLQRDVGQHRSAAVGEADVAQLAAALARVGVRVPSSRSAAFCDIVDRAVPAPNRWCRTAPAGSSRGAARAMLLISAKEMTPATITMSIGEPRTRAAR